MSVSREEVLRIAALAELKVDEESVSELAEQMSRILEYVEQLGGVVGTDVARPVRAWARRGSVPAGWK